MMFTKFTVWPESRRQLQRHSSNHPFLKEKLFCAFYSKRIYYYLYSHGSNHLTKKIIKCTEFNCQVELLNMSMGTFTFLVITVRVKEIPSSSKSKYQIKISVFWIKTAQISRTRLDLNYRELVKPFLSTKRNHFPYFWQKKHMTPCGILAYLNSHWPRSVSQVPVTHLNSSQHPCSSQFLPYHKLPPALGLPSPSYSLFCITLLCSPCSLCVFCSFFSHYPLFSIACQSSLFHRQPWPCAVCWPCSFYFFICSELFQMPLALLFLSYLQ